MNTSAVLLFIVFGHPDDVKASSGDSMDERFAGEPRIHQYTGCFNARFKRTVDQGSCSLRLLHYGIFPRFCAIGPPVNRFVCMV